LNYTKLTLFAIGLVLFTSFGTNSIQAQTADSHQKSADERKGEVDLALKDLREHNEPVLKRCLENCPASTGAEDPKVAVGEMVNKVQPVYPPIARAAHASGEVVVMVIVDEEGKVIAAQTVSGHPLLQAASVKAAKESNFNPTLVSGRPVKVMGTITYRFIL